MGKSPLNVNAVKTIRRLVQHKPLHSLLLNLGCDLMLRASDLLKLKVRDVITSCNNVDQLRVGVKMFNLLNRKYDLDEKRSNILELFIYSNFQITLLIIIYLRYFTKIIYQSKGRLNINI